MKYDYIQYAFEEHTNAQPSNVLWNMRTLMVPVLPARIACLPKPVLDLTGSRFQ